MTKIRDQQLSTVIANHCECDNCHVVDRDINRARMGYLCPKCGAKSEGGNTYFHFCILSMIDLMQEFYHTSSKGAGGLSVDSHKLAVVVFFCTLVETLLENLLREGMCIQKIPGQVQERLLSDNLTSKQRINKLFPALFDDKWQDAISVASRAYPKMKYNIALSFFIKVVGARNKFLHPPGNKWAIKYDMPSQCLRQTPVLISLFVWLHNHYIVEKRQQELSPPPE